MPSLHRRLKVILKNLSNHLRSEYFFDALRTTLSIILPFALIYCFIDPHLAVTVGVGALLVSLTDSPGTLGDKLVMSVSSLSLFFIISMMTALVMNNVVLLGLLIFILCMIFALFNVFGKRWSLLGTMALILMTFVLGLKPVHPLLFSSCIVAGGFFYYVISLLQTRIWPLSSVKHALGECLISTADFLYAKAAFYNPESDLKLHYSRLVKLHNKVNDKQEQVRDLLLRNKSLMRYDHAQGQQHLLALIQVIDLYEVISAIQYDYKSLQASLEDTGLLGAVTRLIKNLSNDLKVMGISLSSKLRVRLTDSSESLLTEIRHSINALPKDRNSARILVSLQGNIDEIYAVLRQINKTLNSKPERLELPDKFPAYQLFTSPETISWYAIKKNIDLNSPLFRFALRLSFACLVAYVLMLLPLGLYSYWILLTVIVVLKPGFGLTKKRNLQRLKGTIAGILIGMLVLTLTGNLVLLLSFSGLFLLGYFAYLRLNYTLSIMSLTPMIVICLNLYTSNPSIIQERVFDTLVGCAIAFLAPYLFPSWEIKRHGIYIGDVIRANLNYLSKLYDQTAGIPLDITTFKLARKEVYIRLTILSSGIQNMLLEPKKAQGQIELLNEFEVLNHQLSSTIASFFSSGRSIKDFTEIKAKIKEAMEILENSLSDLAQLKYSTDHLIASTLKTLDAGHPDHIQQHKVNQIISLSEAIRTQVSDYIHASKS